VAQTLMYEFIKSAVGLGMIYGYSKAQARSQDTYAASETVEAETTDPQVRQIPAVTMGFATAGAVRPNPWPQLIGRYRNDPTWEEFDGFLKAYRKKVNRIYSQSEAQRQK